MSDNEVNILKARLAEVERERDEALERLAMADASLLLETGAGINTHETMLRVSKRWCARAHAAEARVAVLEKALERIAVLPDCGCKPCTGQCRSQAVLLIELEEIRALAAVASRPAPVEPPGMTDLMVTPESLDAFMEANPLPDKPTTSDTVGEPVATEADIAAIIEEQMLDAWNTICSDTDCHPLDIKQVGRRRLEFHSGHWSRQTAEFSAHRILQKLYTHPPKSPDTSAAVLQRVALEQALNSLAEIASSHIPDCPAHYAGEELAWAQRHVGCLRQKAEIARDGIAAAIRQLPTSKD